MALVVQVVCNPAKTKLVVLLNCLQQKYLLSDPASVTATVGNPYAHVLATHTDNT